MSGTDFELWGDELIETTYLHECADGGSTTVRRTGRGLTAVHIEPQHCAGCGVEPMIMRRIGPDEFAALNAGLWRGLPHTDLR